MLTLICRGAPLTICHKFASFCVLRNDYVSLFIFPPYFFIPSMTWFYLSRKNEPTSLPCPWQPSCPPPRHPLIDREWAGPPARPMIFSLSLVLKLWFFKERKRRLIEFIRKISLRFKGETHFNNLTPLLSSSWRQGGCKLPVGWWFMRLRTFPAKATKSNDCIGFVTIMPKGYRKSELIYYLQRALHPAEERWALLKWRIQRSKIISKDQRSIPEGQRSLTATAALIRRSFS